ncbi:BZ3500_MvSof-1268-A1-R1_Chr2-1g04590 [Microbotryum saponariae]|uniref:Midasin n=1 Tax=Microbotryum saponariae TaxID=289078 RepID=A0A2X0K967_9BASI|nr:BZ3500_MvSof-1268-A1-R1_Chr2-1g04590 [Microbotryum saponariae]SCZ92109.1 BZ3501_MvSof-1269-A2-R1_Chr2-1g04246 [Microbotryum saponariae]
MPFRFAAPQLTECTGCERRRHEQREASLALLLQQFDAAGIVAPSRMQVDSPMHDVVSTSTALATMTEMAAPRSPPAAPAAPAPSLRSSTVRFLRGLGILPDEPASDATTPPAGTEPKSIRNRRHLSTQEWLGLVPTSYAMTLLSIVPAHLRPSDTVASAEAASSGAVLQVITRLALEPSLTLAVHRFYRAYAPHLWGTWLEWLGYDSAEPGQWPASTQAADQLDIVKAIDAMVCVLRVDQRVFPFLVTLLRHPALSTFPIDSSNPIPSLLTLHSLLHYLPQLPTSHLTTSASRPLPWAFPTEVENLLKSHPLAKVRLLASKCLNKWYGLNSNTGKQIERIYVPTSRQEMELAPMPDYPNEIKLDFEQSFGVLDREEGDEWIISDWEHELVGQSNWVEGGVQVLVRRGGVDLWVLELLTDIRDREEKALFAQEPEEQDFESLDWELSKIVCEVEGRLTYREGLLPSIGAVTSSSSASTSSARELAKTLRPEAFILTPSNRQLIRSLSTRLVYRQPTLITSSPSSGKLSALNHLWTLVHASSSPGTGPTLAARQRQIVIINLADRSLDSKSLLGSLSSAPTTSESTAGSFTFIEGPLTRALRQGRWLVLTNIDQASVEVLTVIKSVAERMKTASETMLGGAWGDGADQHNFGVGVKVGGGAGRWVKAGAGFMLFATRSTTSSEGAEFFGQHFFKELRLPGLEGAELKQVIEGRFEKLGQGLGRKMIEVWESVRSIKGKEVGGGTKRDGGVRDLLRRLVDRWCRRVEGLLPTGVVIKSIDTNPTLQEEIFIEARDVFLGSMSIPRDPGVPQNDRYSVIARKLAEGLSLSDERAYWVLRRRVPEFIEPIIDVADGHLVNHDGQGHVLKIGRVGLPYRPVLKKAAGKTYAHTNPSLIVLEKLAVAVRLSEPVLLVGETGTGKTAAVGHLADKMGKRLTALNLSNQTEAGDLVGGFRPIDEREEARRHASMLFNAFVELFGKTFSLSRNAEYVSHAKKAFEKKRWQRLVGLCREAARMASDRFNALEGSPEAKDMATDEAEPRKRRKLESKSKEDLPGQWDDFLVRLGEFDLRHVQKAVKAKFVFSFVEGPLAKAIREGEWVLLDEVNLASAETLESLSTLLQGPDSSLVLTEQGDLEPIPRHPEFRLFACMNPATDVGKRDLPSGLRAKFSEVWVPPPDEDRDALVKIVEGYIARHATSDLPVIHQTADLYSAVKQLAINAQLADGSNHPPHFSMRTLARALTFAAEFAETFGSLRRALYEGFLMSFTMLLDPNSQIVVLALLKKHIVDPARNAKSLFRLPVKKPPASTPAVQIAPYWLLTGDQTPEIPIDYILTPSVQRKVCDLARAALTRKVPVLIQGPTSAGKTSVIEYLARRTGHRFVRINNHEHTDIQEYIGTYVSDPDSGKLVFQEGVLVRALRRGDWIVLDELNLAPTDVLEALNRLLDDNRELVIPETGELVRPHPHFMLFATQNPPGLYGGRKVLSRAFRNRFLEMHFGDVPQDELETILCERCQIAPSYAKKTVAVFVELQRRRQAGRVFEQKHAFATLRDLFRWGGRGSVGYQQLAEDGYMLLAERARRADDKEVVKEVIEKEMKVTIDAASLYDFSRLAELELPDPRSAQGDLVWTSAMRRLYFLIAAALKRDEPVLLVGETGAGKTSVCQALALALGRQLHIVGCHQNTETADLLGGQRPLRNRAALQADLKRRALALFESAGLAASAAADDDFEQLIVEVEVLLPNFNGDDLIEAESVLDRMRQATALFEWHDGPLVQAMVAGDFVLLDEISLADDSVLERLNSVLEPSRTLLLAEKGGRDLADIQIRGAPGFQILATMNPGGDFGKKELSPALRNRFTEIWVPSVDDLNDLRLIIYSRWLPDHERELAQFGDKMLDFAQWFAKAAGASDGLGIGLRDILAWIDFLNKSASFLATVKPVVDGTYVEIETDEIQAHAASVQPLHLGDAFCQGALMTVVDGLGALPLTSSMSREGLDRLRVACWRYLESLVSVTVPPEAVPLDVVDSPTRFAIGPFGVEKGALPSVSNGHSLLAPTARLNAMRLLRALQLKKPVLLEGSPGVGKTSLVTAIAAATGHHLVRINLSDQTDLMDLLGSDLPVEGGQSGQFAWKDAPFLAAMQAGDWVLLDEMNLASQSILEGLNSSLDHRGAVYIPELDRTFVRHPDFRIFAAQNPLGQGGGRKGLPKSFLDRFSIVHMEELDAVDLGTIAGALYDGINPVLLNKMISFNSTIHHQTMQLRSFGAEGSPWEFNLRDVLRWLALVHQSGGLDLHPGNPIEYVGLLYVQRFRNAKDRAHVARMFEEHFGVSIDPLLRPTHLITDGQLRVGHSFIERSDGDVLERSTIAKPILQPYLQTMEALVKCFDMRWLAILTGPKGCGKTSVVRQIAFFKGVVLREFSMSAEVDTLELLGSFEQAERSRELEKVVVALEAAMREQPSTFTPTSLGIPPHELLVQLRQLRVDLGSASAEVSARLLVSSLQSLASGASVETAAVLHHFASQFERAIAVTSVAARFEWIDGPLVQAMKQGHWLLIEDANLCSPSVLDRLNSLFEPEGRLQLAERGPVNGVVQTITPQPDFRLVMSLDPRNGELSRAMRNRGIEIAMLPVEADSTLQERPRSSTVTPSESIADMIEIASRTQELSPLVVAQTMLSYLSPFQFGFALRLLRATRLCDVPTIEASMRGMAAHPLVPGIVARRNATALLQEVPAPLLALEPIDMSLVTHEGTIQTPANSVLSPALDAVCLLLLVSSNRPDLVSHVLAKPRKSLSAWERSLLVLHGKMRLDEDDVATASLVPVSHALTTLVRHMLAAAVVGDLTFEQQQECVELGSRLGGYVAELEHVCSSSVLDFSSIQHVAAWIASEVGRAPVEAFPSAAAVQTALTPLQTSLALTSGKAMNNIWRACLPFEPASPAINSAYRDLLERGAGTDGPVWDRALVDLFLEIAVALGTPQSQHGVGFGDEASVLARKLIASLPPVTTEGSSLKDESTALVNSSNAASVLVAELAAVAKVITNDYSHSASTSLIRVVHRSQALSLASIVPIHQLASWPREYGDQSSAQFKTLLLWNEHLALGLSQITSTYTPADVTRPFLLREVVQLKTKDTSSLGNLVVLSEGLGRAATIQTWTASLDLGSRRPALKSVLLASIGLLANATEGTQQWEASGLAGLSAADADSPAFGEAFDRYLAPAMTSLADPVEASLAILGQGFVAFSRCLWYLYLPNLPLDPAIGLRARSGYLSRQLDHLSGVLQSLHLAELHRTGNAQNDKIDRLSKKLDDLRPKLDEAKVVPVQREGNPALLSSLFQELQSFREQIISEAQLDTLTNDLMGAAPTESVLSRELSMQRSVETLLHRLNAVYGELVDILAPLRLSLCSLKVGFALLSQLASLKLASASSPEPFVELLHHLVSFPKAAHKHRIDAIDLPLTIKANQTPLSPTRATLLQVTALISQLTHSGRFDRDALRRLTQLYDRLHYLWTSDRRKDEEAARAAESLYRSKADVEQIATDEELEAAEFAQLFPTFEDALDFNDSVDKPPATNGSITAVNGATASAKVFHHLQPQDEALLAKLHVGLLGNGRIYDFVGKCEKEYDSIRTSSITTLLPDLYAHLEEGLDRASAAYRVRSLVELSQSMKPSTSSHPAESRDRDFYTEPDVQETAKAVPILLATSARLSDLIETWPDQMVLRNLHERCQAVLSLSSQSPIAQVLTAIEQLLQHTEDWESYASSEHSLATNRAEIINLIIEWRRTELTCWSRLLSTIEKRFKAPVATWWFRFYETMIRAAPGVDEDPATPTHEQKSAAEFNRELVALLDSFFSTCSIGQFQARLELTLSFANLASKLGSQFYEDAIHDGARSLNTVAQLLLNIHAFYDQFTPRISAFLCTERAKIHKDVNSLIKLASWKDVNVYALRQSAIRSHHQLYKLVRKLRAVLQKPASDFFTRSESAQSTELSIAPHLATRDLALVLNSMPSLPKEITAATSASHIANLDRTLRRLAAWQTMSLGPFIGANRAGQVDAFAVEIIRTSKDLKSEPLGGEEGRDQRLKSLIARKRRAWIELLREMKRVGLSPSPAPAIVDRLKDAGHVYTLPSPRRVFSLDVSLLPEDQRRLLREVDDYHYRMTSELPALRACPANHHDDVSTREVQRAIGSIESGVAMSFDSRVQLVPAIMSASRLRFMASKMESVGAEPIGQSVATTKALAELLLELVCEVSSGLSDARVELNNHRVALDGRPTDDLSVVAKLIDDSDRVLVDDVEQLRELAAIDSFDPVIGTKQELEIIRTAHTHLRSIVDAFTILEAPVSIRYLVDPLGQWIRSLRLPSVEPEEVGPSSAVADLGKLNTQHATLIDSILVIAQELRTRAEGMEKVDPDGETRDHAIKLDHRSLQETLAVWRSDEILDQAVALARSAHALLGSSVALQPAVCALLLRVAPFIRLFVDLLSDHLVEYLRWMRAILKLAYVASTVVKELAAQGFCRPVEDDGKGGEEADGKTSDGTGMADGKGAKNVSNEIEDESQIEGLENDVQQEKEKNEHQDEEDGQDDAIETNMDFEGDLEDRGDQDKDDQDKDDEDSDEDEDAPEPDEQITDVDPLDPSTVDEKFWGDEASKDEPKDSANEELNQETEQKSGKSEMTAKDDQAPEPKSKGKDSSAEKDQPEQPEEEKSGREVEQDGKDEAEKEGDEVENAEQDDDEGEDQDAPPQADDKDRLNHQMPEGDNLDLPEDLNLDGEEEKEDQAKDLDLDDMDVPADPDDGAHDDGDDQVDEMGDSNEDPGEADDALVADADADADGEPQPDNPEEDAPQPDQQASLDDSSGGAQDGEQGGEGSQDKSASARPDPKPSSTDAPTTSGAQQELTEAMDPRQAPADDAQDQEMNAEDDATEAPLSAPSNAASGTSKERSAATDPQAQPQADRSTPAQPQRSLGDAMQSWRRRLEQIADMSEVTEESPAEVDHASNDKDGEVEYVVEGQEHDADKQALGPASEEQVKKLEQLRLGDEEEPQKHFDADDAMQVDEAPNADPTKQPSSTINLDGSSLAETDAKAIPAADLRDQHPVDPEDGSALDEKADHLEDEDDELRSRTLATQDDAEADHQVEQAMLLWRSGDDPTMTADGVWRLYESLTRDLSYALTEQLRLILEPTLATRLKGDYRSGKRLNLKKIIPYIASEFTKDKIWLRRTRPSQREYQILIAIDDSKSMADSHSVHLAFQSLALISRALTRLEVGGISICRFGDTMDVLHPFEGGQLSDDAGAKLLEQFTFSQRTTDVRLLVERSLTHLALAKDAARSGKSSLAAGDLWQLQIIISDGMCQDHGALRALLRRAAEQKVMFVFVVIDSLHRQTLETHSGSSTPVTSSASSTVNQNSILAMQSVSYSKGSDGRLELNMNRYLDSFPFEYFVVLRDVEALPEVLSATLRQFFERVSSDR